MLEYDEKMNLKPLSVMTNVVGLQTDNAGNVGQNSSAHVARVVGLQTDAVVVTETRLKVTLSLVYQYHHQYYLLCSSTID